MVIFEWVSFPLLFFHFLKSDFIEVRTMSDLRFCEKKRVGDVQFQIKSEKQKKRGLEIGRGSGPTPVARGGSGAKALPLDARPVPLNGRGRRLVELTNGC